MILNNNKLLKTVSSHYNVNLSEVALIGCQHILGTTVDMLDQLFKDGLKPWNTYLIGKCYSTNNSVFNKIKKIGVNIDENSKTFHSHLSYDDQFFEYTNRFINNSLQEIGKLSYKKIIVLDDGGYLISCINARDDLKFDTITAVEQTTSGYEKVSRIGLKFPVINVARSKAKLEIESPIIADIIIKEIKKFFKRYNLKKPDILIVGDGYIGNNLLNKLAKDFMVDSYDLISHNEPFPGVFADTIKKYDVIIGSTGRKIISGDTFKFLKSQTYLISTSSSDREFSAFEIRQKIPEYNECHLDTKSDGLIIANSGFPINFTGGVHSAPPKKIILTRSLLLAGVLEASQITSSKGLIELSQNIQDIIIKNFATDIRI